MANEEGLGRLGLTALVVLIAALAGGLVGGAIVWSAEPGPQPRAAGATVAPRPLAATRVRLARPVRANGALAPETIYRRDAPGVVVITATQSSTSGPTLLGPSPPQNVQVLGSGFVVDRRGDIVTNDHVVAGGRNVRVGFSNGATYPAKVVGVDPSTDLAVVHVNAPASALHPLTVGDSAAAQVGDPVYAIGNPFGLDRTLTAGVVSALGRDISAPNGLAIPDAIQTDAAINHGNSGGPLLNRFGQVIGIDDQIESGGVNGNVGVGFAIASDTAKQVVPQLIAHGKAEHAWLGVRVETIDPAITGTLKGVPSHGVLVVGVVHGSPAAKAGLAGGSRQVTVNGVGAVVGGDAIVSVDGKPVRSATELANAVAAHRPGQQLRLGVARGGHERTVTVTLGNAPAHLPSGA